MSWRISYRHGALLLVVGGRAMVVMEPGVPDPVVSRVHDQLAGGSTAAAACDLLADAGSAGLVAAGLTALGDGRFQVEPATMTVLLDGREIPGGNRELVVTGASIQFATHGSRPAPDEGRHRWLRLVDGVAWCDRVRVDWVAGSVAVPAAAAAGPVGGLIGSRDIPVFRRSPAPSESSEPTPARDEWDRGIATAHGQSGRSRRESSEDEDAPMDKTVLRGAHVVDTPHELVPARADAAPTVRAIACEVGHPNAPEAHVCRICGRTIAAARVIRVPRPTLGVLRRVGPAPDAPECIPLVGELVLGCDAPVPGSEGAATHIQVGSRRAGVAGRHLHIEMEGWHVLVADLGSAGGTMIEIPGAGPTRLGTRQPTLITPGTTIRLAESLAYRFEVSR